MGVAIYQDEDGVFIAECPAIPGCVSQAASEAEAEANVMDAIRECLAGSGGDGVASHCRDAGNRSCNLMPAVAAPPAGRADLQTGGGRASDYVTRCTATLDHVRPVAEGGDNSFGNLVTACLGCNSRKHKRPVGDFLAEQ